MTIPTTVSVAPADEYPADGHTMTDKLTATLDKAGVRAISTDLWGIFFEDISYSGDGGLNADLVQNGASNTTAPTPSIGATTASGAKSCRKARSQLRYP